MRHRRLRRKLGITTQHRKALLRNLVRALVAHKRIATTHARAKEASAFADKMVTLAKKGDLHARRLLLARLNCAVTAKALVNEIAPHFKDRQGGYTRVIRTQPRAGDMSEMALLEFTALIEAPKKPRKVKEKKKTEGEYKAPSVPKPAPEKETKVKKKTKKEEESAVQGKEEAPKEETEKRGGFLGALRKFLKGSD